MRANRNKFPEKNRLLRYHKIRFISGTLITKCIYQYTDRDVFIKKSMFSDSAVSNPFDGSKRFTLQSWQIDMFIPAPTLLLYHSTHAAITCEDYSLTFPSLYISRYSITQLSELRHRGENENAQTSKCDSHQGSLDHESGILQLFSIAIVQLLRPVVERNTQQPLQSLPVLFLAYSLSDGVFPTNLVASPLGWSVM